MTRCEALFEECNKDEIYKQARGAVNYAFIRDGYRRLIIYFEPSDGKLDWRNNFAFKKRPYKDMKVPYKVHGGFLKCWKAVEDKVIDKVLEKRSNGAYRWQQVTIVGYSHGAALAALCHECVWFHREDLRGGRLLGIGFEAPRVYGALKVKKDLAQRWDNFYVVRNGRDIVTHAPPRIFGFTHVGKIVKTTPAHKAGCIEAHTPWNMKDSLAMAENIEALREIEEKLEHGRVLDSYMRTGYFNRTGCF